MPSAFAGPSQRPTRPVQDTPILSRLPVPLLVHSGDVLHYANDEFLALTGYDTVEQLAEAGGLGALFADSYDDEFGEEADDRAIRLRTRDGLEFPIEALLRSVPWNGGKALMLVVRRTGDERRSCGSGRPKFRRRRWLSQRRTLRTRRRSMRSRRGSPRCAPSSTRRPTASC